MAVPSIRSFGVVRVGLGHPLDGEPSRRPAPAVDRRVEIAHAGDSLVMADQCSLRIAPERVLCSTARDERRPERGVRNAIRGWPGILSSRESVQPSSPRRPCRCASLVVGGGRRQRQQPVDNFNQCGAGDVRRGEDARVRVGRSGDPAREQAGLPCAVGVPSVRGHQGDPPRRHPARVRGVQVDLRSRLPPPACTRWVSAPSLSPAKANPARPDKPRNTDQCSGERSNGEPEAKAGSAPSNADTAGTAPASTAPRAPGSGPDTASWPTTWSRSAPPGCLTRHRTKDQHRRAGGSHPPPPTTPPAGGFLRPK
jgi:hypothetical protein